MQNTNLGPFFKVKDFINAEGNRFIRYDGGAYILTITLQKDFIYLQIFQGKDAPRYTPDMYIRCDNHYLPVRVEIQTTSYGALSPFKTEQVIQGFRHAVDTAAAIQEKFIAPIRAGLFVFGDPIPQEEEEEKC